MVEAYQKASIESVRQVSATFDKQVWDWKKTLAYAEAKLKEESSEENYKKQDNLESAFKNALALNTPRTSNPIQSGNFLTPEQKLARQQAADLRAALKEIAELKEQQYRCIEKSTAELSKDNSTSDLMDE